MLKKCIHLAAAAATVVVMVAVPTLSAVPTATGIDDSKGTPGFCKTDEGVTVVVDFQQLGGSAIVRCFPSAQRGTGLDALVGAGFQIEGNQRYGSAFICRIENRPSAVEALPIKGNEGYKERCVDTSPAGAYWSYWTADNNCGWEYSQWGVKNRDFIQGGFEGWSFSLNASADSNPKPRIAAVRPGTAGQACGATSEAAPSSNDPAEQQGQNAGANGGEAPAASETDTNSADNQALPAPKPRARSEAPEAENPDDNIAYTGGQDDTDVTEAVKEQASASDYAPWIAVAAMLVLAGLTWGTARRRKRARQDS